MPHFFINSKNKQNNQIVIDDKENYNHIAKSLRSKIGEKLLVIDENEVEYITEIQEINSSSIILDIISFEKSKRKLSYNIYLAQSPLNSNSQNTVVEKSTELGVAGIYPVYTDNCSLKKSVLSSKIDKWQRVMYEASKQCERANIPTCYELTTLESLINDNKFNKKIAFCEKYTNVDLKTFLAQYTIEENDNILVIIGPEGGFSDREFNLFKDNNIPMVSLGNLILKAETAVIVALGNIIYECGE